MKKMSSRNATSTIGVISMRTPSRRLGRPKPLPFFLVLRSGVSTAPTWTHLPKGSLATGPRGEQPLLPLEIGLHVEARRLGLLQRGHQVRHHAIRRVLVH